MSPEGEPDALRAYYDGLRDAPVPARLMMETPPEAVLRRLTTNLAWASAGIVLALLVSALPTPTDPVAAGRTAHLLTMREAAR